MNTQTLDLKSRWEMLLKEQPKLRIRNAAQELDVSEMELLATRLDDDVVLLKPLFAEILEEVKSLGKVMALTRNDTCVHERKGVYLNPDFSSPHAGLFVGEDIDLRIFLAHWKTAFAVDEGAKKSLQFFGKDGMAIHKIYLTKDSDEKAFETLVQKYIAPEQHTTIAVEALPEKPEETPDTEIDVESFQKAWTALKDTHHFFGMLRKFGVSRTQALRLAPNNYYASKIDNSKVVTLLEESAATGLPIMVFTGNHGNIQIHTGSIKRTLWHGSWFNVMDPDFNLHLDTARIDQTWIVRKPTEDGVVTAVEVFDASGEIIVQFFGKRKPGIPELEAWRELVAGLEA